MKRQDLELIKTSIEDLLSEVNENFETDTVRYDGIKVSIRVQLNKMLGFINGLLAGMPKDEEKK